MPCHGVKIISKAGRGIISCRFHGAIPLWGMWSWLVPSVTAKRATRRLPMRWCRNSSSCIAPRSRTTLISYSIPPCVNSARRRNYWTISHLGSVSRTLQGLTPSIKQDTIHTWTRNESTLTPTASRNGSARHLSLLSGGRWAIIANMQQHARCEPLQSEKRIAKSS